jgi:hypothetical protein
MRIIASLAIIMSIACLLPAQETSLSEAKSLLPIKTLPSFRCHTKIPGVTMERVTVEGQDFKEALRVTVPSYTEGKSWGVQVISRMTGSISKGDVLQLTFKMRTIEATAGKGEPADGKGKIAVLLQKHENGKYILAIPPKEVTAGSEWKQFTYYARVTKAEHASDTGVTLLIFRCYFQKQIVEIADIHLDNLGPLKTIPSTPGSLLPIKTLPSFKCITKKSGVTMEKVAVEGQDFKEALRVTVPSYAGGHSWGVQVSSAITGSISKGDVLQLTFKMRTIEAVDEKGIIAVLLQKHENGKYILAIPPKEVTAGSEWEQFTYNIRVEKPEHASDPDITLLIFRCNYQKQIIEIADIHLENLGPLKTIPGTPEK